MYHFQLLRADEFTAKYMGDRPDKFPQANLTEVVDKLKKLVFRHKNYDEFLVWLIKTVDPSKAGTIKYDDLYKRLTAIIPLTHQEVYTIFKYCHTEDTTLSMKTFWKLMGGA